MSAIDAVTEEGCVAERAQMNIVQRNGHGDRRQFADVPLFATNPAIGTRENAITGDGRFERGAVGTDHCIKSLLWGAGVSPGAG